MTMLLMLLRKYDVSRKCQISHVKILFGMFVGCVCLALAGAAWAAQTLSIRTTFTPDKLGASTNLSATALFGSTTPGVPSPIRHVTAYGPAGLTLDVRGAGTCTVAKLEAVGPSACPADSRIGFGGGVGLLELAGEVIHEPFTLDFFLGPREGGRVAVLIYVNAVTPVSVQLVLTAREVYGPKPYGWGVSFDIPTIPTLPGASYASVEKTSFTFGDSKVAYFRTIHGKRRLVHVKGLIVPKSCPAGGFPYEAAFSFEDGTANTYKGTIPCPR
ncbi:MAG TPA: hypothetical protein VID70_01960 [Solirubrobacteraceae bacterium]|jgi:hypothetical protein